MIFMYYHVRKLAIEFNFLNSTNCIILLALERERKRERERKDEINIAKESL